MDQQNLVEDGFSVQPQGMNAGRTGSRLNQFQFQLLINGTARGDYVHQRPGMRNLARVVGPGNGFFQHGSCFVQRSTQRVYLIAVVGGRFFRTDPITKDTAEFTIPGDPNAGVLEHGWSTQAEDFWIYNDGLSRPLIYSGAAARRARGNELQVGTVIDYANGRVWYSTPDGYGFRAGDLVGNPDSGTPQYNYRDAVLHETENTYLSGGSDFAVPQDSGGITAMRAVSNLDTSQGQGPLLVACLNSMFTANAPVDRDTWESVSYPLETVALPSAGFTSQDSTVNLNGDILGRSLDGIRSFIIARRAFRDWGNTPQSFEVSEFLDADQKDLLLFGSAVIYDNRLLMTVSPAFTQAGVYHRGLIALDLEPIASMLERGVPNYDGIWTGLNILQVVQTPKSAFLYVLANDGGVDLWQFDKDALYDNIDGRIQWSFVPRTMFTELDSGSNKPIWQLKRLEDCQLSYDELAGAVQFTVFWKPDSYPCWTEWRSWSECAPVCVQNVGCTPPTSFSQQYRPNFRLGEPPDLCAQGTKGLPLRNFYEADFRIDVSGPAQLRAARFLCTKQGTPVWDPTCEEAECLNLSCCGTPIFTYQAKQVTWYEYRDNYGNPYYQPANPPTSPNEGGTGGTTPGQPNQNPTGGGASPPTVLPSVPGTPQDPLQLPTWPNPPSLGCNVFFPTIEDPDTPDKFREIGTEEDPALGLIDASIIGAWAAAAWGSFSSFLSSQGFTATKSQLVWYFDPTPPPGGSRRWNASEIFTDDDPTYFDAFGLNWTLVVEYCLP